MATATCSLFSSSPYLPLTAGSTTCKKKPNHPPRHVNIRMSLQPPNSPPPPSQDLLKSITKLLWGQSLPPQLLISTARSIWTSTWRLMMSQLAPSDRTGSYTRPASRFRADQLIPKSSTLVLLHLYVGLPCPWAHRTLIVRALKGLEDAIPVSIASPGLEGAWEFKDYPANRVGGVVGPTRDRANGCGSLREVYGLRAGGYSGRVTVPMLWDVERKEVVCNESYDIIQLFSSGFNEVAGNPGLDLAPVELRPRIEEWNRVIYPNVNNGVYRCGFAQSQEAYDVAVNQLFDTLDIIEDHLKQSRYLCGDQLTLADICLFTTLIRFDPVYNVLFKCTKKKLLEYTNLHAYMRDIYQIPKVAETCNFEEIMNGYYKILFPLNPGSIRPVIPCDCEHGFLSTPHNRETLSTLSGIKEAPRTYVI